MRTGIVGFTFIIFVLTGCEQVSVTNTYDINGDVAAITTDTLEASSPAPVGYHLPRQGALSGMDLASWARLKRDDKSGDQFRKGFDDSSIANRQFVFELPMAGRDIESEASWRYDKDKGALTLEVEPSYSAGSNGRLLTILRSESFGDKHAASNAFGATVDVTPETKSAIGVGALDERMGLFPTEHLGGEHWSASMLTITVPMAGEEARKLTDRLVLRVDGRVVKDRNGHTVECDEHHEDPTISNPYDVTDNTCTVQAKFSRIAFVTKEGRTVKEWATK